MKLSSISEIIIVLVFVLVSGCIAMPEKVEVEQGNEARLSCHELYSERERAETLWQKANEHDRFKARYIFLPVGVVSGVNVIRARDAAHQRMQYLDSVIAEKGCDGAVPLKLKDDYVPELTDPGSTFPLPGAS